jgi:hypothetical protein
MSKILTDLNHMNKSNFDAIIAFVCCLIIALGLSDIFFANKFTDGIVSVIAGTILMPGIMTWDFAKANKYQKVFLITVAVLNTSLIIYLIYKFFNR